MKCVYCNKGVWGKHGVTVPGVGPAHFQCFQTDLGMRRMFKGLEITQLDDSELAELQDMVLAETNHRRRDARDDVDLF